MKTPLPNENKRISVLYFDIRFYIIKVVCLFKMQELCQELPGSTESGNKKI